MNETCVECHASRSIAQVASEPLAVLAVRAGCALEASIVRCADSEDQTLGHLEVQVAHDVKELLRAALERGAQAKADGASPLCPVCQQKLTRLSAGHPRTFQTRHGAITVKRTRGYCKRHGCRQPNSKIGKSRKLKFETGSWMFAEFMIFVSSPPL